METDSNLIISEKKFREVILMVTEIFWELR